jgi:hypothetical protein
VCFLGPFSLMASASAKLKRKEAGHGEETEARKKPRSKAASSASEEDDLPEGTLRSLSEALGVSIEQLTTVRRLLQGGATIPFLARYRRAVTQGKRGENWLALRLKGVSGCS